MKYHDMIHAPEGKTLEFKQDLSSHQPVLKTLTDFVNSAVINALRLRFVVGLGTPVPVTPTGRKGQAQGGAQVEAQDQAQVGAQVDHPKNRLQKYRLTEKGKKWLNKEFKNSNGKGKLE